MKYMFMKDKIEYVSYCISFEQMVVEDQGMHIVLKDYKIIRENVEELKKHLNIPNLKVKHGEDFGFFAPDHVYCIYNTLEKLMSNHFSELI